MAAVQLLFAYDSARDHVEPSDVKAEFTSWGRKEVNEISGRALDNFRLVVVSDLTEREAQSLMSPEIELAELDDLKPSRKATGEKWWIFPVSGLPSRVQDAFRSGANAGRRVELTRAEFMAWVTQSPRVNERVIGGDTVLPPRYEPPPEKPRTQV